MQSEYTRQIYLMAELTVQASKVIVTFNLIVASLLIVASYLELQYEFLNCDVRERAGLLIILL